MVRYKKTVPDIVEHITKNTRKTYFVLSLPLPQQAVSYVVSVAGVAGTERGYYSDGLTLHYSSMYYCLCLHALDSNTHVSESSLARLQIACSLIHAYYTLHLQDQVPPLVSLPKHSPVTH